MTRRLTAPLPVLLASLVLLWPSAARAQYGATNGEWRTYAGDLGGTKYSPLDQIDESNFSDLEIAWRWESADGRLDLDALRELHPEIGIRNFKTTPTNGRRRRVCLNSARLIGRARRRHRGSALGVRPSSLSCGSLSACQRPQLQHTRARPTGPMATRRTSCTARMTDTFWAVDAETGRPVASFGDNGRVDLTEGIPRATRGTTDRLGYSWIGVASAPIVAPRRGRDTDGHLRSPDYEGGSTGVGQGHRRPNRRHEVDVPDGPAGGRLRRRQLAERIVALLGQHQRLVDVCSG